MKIDDMPADALETLHGSGTKNPSRPLTPEREEYLRALPDMNDVAQNDLGDALRDLGEMLDWERARADRATRDAREAWRIYREDREESLRLQTAVNARALKTIETIRDEALTILREQDLQIRNMDRALCDAEIVLAEVRSKLQDASPTWARDHLGKKS